VRREDISSSRARTPAVAMPDTARTKTIRNVRTPRFKPGLGLRLGQVPRFPSALSLGQLPGRTPGRSRWMMSERNDREGPSLAGAKDDKAEGNEQDDGVHGGPIERSHTAGSCDLTAVSSLPGNWTHGDYVSAVAANGNAAQIREAAHSDCGKPMVAVGHGGGPPAHALEHMAAG
jgi:hypothetical protein